jgi:hypothetical protein
VPAYIYIPHYTKKRMTKSNWIELNWFLTFFLVSFDWYSYVSNRLLNNNLVLILRGFIKRLVVFCFCDLFVLLLLHLITLV